MANEQQGGVRPTASAWRPSHPAIATEIGAARHLVAIVGAVEAGVEGSVIGGGSRICYRRATGRSVQDPGRHRTGRPAQPLGGSYAHVVGESLRGQASQSSAPTITDPRKSLKKVAPQAGLEPATLRLTVAAARSAPRTTACDDGLETGGLSPLGAGHGAPGHIECYCEGAQFWAQPRQCRDRHEPRNLTRCTHAAVQGFLRRRAAHVA
jgi:hypothetical protein